MASRQAWRRLASGSVLLSNMTCMVSSQIAAPSRQTAHRRLAAGVSPRLRAAAPLEPEISAHLAGAKLCAPAHGKSARAPQNRPAAGRSRQAERLLARSQERFCAAEQQICALAQAEPRLV